MIKEGTEVVCINDTFPVESIMAIPNRPKLNQVYTVREIRYYNHLDKAGVLLEEITNPHNVHNLLEGMLEPSFSITRFAPLDDVLSEISLEELEECVI